MMKDIHLFNDTQLKMKNSLIYLEKLLVLVQEKMFYKNYKIDKKILKEYENKI